MENIKRKKTFDLFTFTEMKVTWKYCLKRFKKFMILKKAYAGKILLHPQVLSETSIEWPLLLNTASVSSRTKTLCTWIVLLVHSNCQKQPPEELCKKRCSQKFRKTHRPACNFIKKEALAQVFSYEFFKISKNILFTEHLLTATASELLYLSF